MSAIASLIEARSSGRRSAVPSNPRRRVLDAVLESRHLISPPAIALEVVRVASDCDCEICDLVALLHRDPALCARILKIVNSCVFSPSRPIVAMDRAVAFLGLNTLRSLVLGMSLPVLQSGGGGIDARIQEFWTQSVAGAMIAREVAVRLKRPSPDSDMVAGLLRDVGAILIQKTCPKQWDLVLEQPAEELLLARCETEARIVGVDHATVSAELLAGWKLPSELVEPIRNHHAPEGLTSPERGLRDRAELLHFVEYLAQLDTVMQFPEAVEWVLDMAHRQFGITKPSLVDLLQGVAPKINEFAQLVRVDVAACPDLSTILDAGCKHLVDEHVSRLAIDANLPRPLEPTAPQLHQTVAMCSRPAAEASAGADHESRSLPAFRAEFIRELPPGGCCVDHYEIRSLLGRGAMGAVFLGHDPRLGRDVGLKIMLPDLAAEPVFRQRFENEARSVAAIRHRNVVTIYSVSVTGSLPYLVMEYVPGGSLDRLIRTDGPLPIPVAIRLGRQVAAGLCAAHAQRIIHRDVKPANILVEAETMLVKVTDFGLAKGLDGLALSAHGDIIGTPQYMSPEQVRGRDVDFRSDLFSLGTVLHEMLTGQPPFRATSMYDLCREICDTDVVSPRDHRPEVPEWLEAMTLKLLNKAPEDRYRSAAEVMARLAKGSFRSALDKDDRISDDPLTLT